MADEPVKVTAHDPVTGETAVHELGPDDYVLLLGANMEVGSLARYANGTIQFTIKRVE